MDRASGGAGRDRVAFALGIALVLVSVLVIEALGTYAFHLDATTRILCAVAVGLLLLGWGGAAIVRPAFRPRTVLAGPLALAMLAFGLSVLRSERPRLSFEPAMIGVASALTLLMLTALLRQPTIRRLVGVLVVLLPIGVSLAYIANVLVEWVRWWTLVGRFTAPPLRPSFVDLGLGSPNLVATYLILFAPLGAAIAARRAGARAAIAILGLALVALVLTGSRSAYVGVAAAVVLAVILGRSAIAGSVRALVARLGDGRLRFVASGIVVLGVLAAAVLGPGLLARVSLSGADFRGWYWRSAMDLWAGSPFVGTGPGTWAQLKLGDSLPSEVNFVVPHAHNLLVQTLTEVGVLGTVALLLVVVTIAIRARAVHRRVDRWAGLEIVAAVAGLVGLVGQQVSDYLMNLPAVALGTGLLIAWIDAAVTEEAGVADPAGAGRAVERATRLAGPLVIVLGVVLVASLPMLGRAADAMVRAEQANVAAAAGDWGTALAGYHAAVARDPEFTLYRIDQANALAHLGRLTEARDTYAAAVNLDLLPQNVIALATLELETGDPIGAVRHARMAIQRSWNDPTILLNAGRILEAAGDTGGAIEAYAAALRNDAPLASSAYWLESDRKFTLRAVVEKARSTSLVGGDVLGAMIISAYAGRIDEARSDLAAIGDPGARRYLSAIIEGIGGDRSSGIATLEQHVAAAPGDFDALVWLVRILTIAGDPAAARFADQALLLRHDEAGTAIQVLSVVPALAQDRYLGAVPGYPFAIYSRKGALDPWPPQVLVIGALTQHKDGAVARREVA